MTSQQVLDYVASGHANEEFIKKCMQQSDRFIIDLLERCRSLYTFDEYCELLTCISELDMDPLTCEFTMSLLTTIIRSEKGA